MICELRMSKSCSESSSQEVTSLFLAMRSSIKGIRDLVISFNCARVVSIFPSIGFLPMIIPMIGAGLALRLLCLFFFC